MTHESERLWMEEVMLKSGHLPGGTGQNGRRSGRHRTKNLLDTSHRYAVVLDNSMLTWDYIVVRVYQRRCPIQMTSETHEDVRNIETVSNATGLSWLDPNIRDKYVTRKVAKVSRNLSPHWTSLKQQKLK